MLRKNKEKKNYLWVLFNDNSILNWIQFPRKLLYFIALATAVLALNPASAQSKKSLEKSKKHLEGKISYTKKLLNETKHQKNASLNDISLLNNQIKNRKELVTVYGRQIKQADQEIESIKSKILVLQSGLKKLKKEYGNLIYQSYKSKSQTDQWMFIFASEDFYQAYSRVKYLQEINEYRREKADRILANEKKLQEKIKDLETLKNSRLQLLIAKEAEADALLGDKNEKQKKVNIIIKKEKKLNQQLAQQRKEWAKLNNEIKRILASKMKKNNSGKSNRIPLTPEEKKLSANFTANKGKLPWPSSRGQITSHFGKHPHPNLHVTVDNKGVDIRCEKGAFARAVFGGKVVSIIPLPKYTAVLVQHGNYFTVYSNLVEVYVAEGEMLKTKQQIGLIGTDKESGETILHFELWSSTTGKPQNPESWIY